MMERSKESEIERSICYLKEKALSDYLWRMSCRWAFTMIEYGGNAQVGRKEKFVWYGTTRPVSLRLNEKDLLIIAYLLRCMRCESQSMQSIFITRRRIVKYPRNCRRCPGFFVESNTCIIEHVWNMWLTPSDIWSFY